VRGYHAKIAKEVKESAQPMNAVGAPRGDAYIPVGADSIVGGSKLLGEMCDLIRRKHYSIRTEQCLSPVGQAPHPLSRQAPS
jgi:hypothetical protein